MTPHLGQGMSTGLTGSLGSFGIARLPRPIYHGTTIAHSTEYRNPSMDGPRFVGHNTVQHVGWASCNETRFCGEMVSVSCAPSRSLSVTAGLGAPLRLRGRARSGRPALSYVATTKEARARMNRLHRVRGTRRRGYISFRLAKQHIRLPLISHPRPCARRPITVWAPAL